MTVFMSQSTVRLSWPANSRSLGTVCGNLLLSAIRFPDMHVQQFKSNKCKSSNKCKVSSRSSAGALIGDTIN